jgi:DNA repair protein RadC
MLNHNSEIYKVIAQKGHRRRICSKLQKNDIETFHDYEIVEMLLFLAFKRKDTKALAKILLKKFGTLNGILEADRQALLSIHGIGQNVYNTLQIIKAVIKATLKDKILQKDAVECFEDVVLYCKMNTRQLVREELRVIYLNGMGYIIGDEVIQKGTVDTVELYTREIIRQCIKVGAKGIILVHNHPSDDPTPSTNDIICTKKMKEACEIFSINLLDHIIIGGEKYISLKKLLIL